MIEKQEERHRVKRPDMKFFEADARDTTKLFDNGEFDVVIEKGLLDNVVTGPT